MSWHCLFCGSSEAWMREKEYENGYGMVEIFVSDGLNGKKISLGVCHADCLKRTLKKGQKAYMQNGEIFEFEELNKFAEVKDD